MRRVSVVGPSGSGKSTLAAQLAARLGVRFVELDALHWGPGWTEATPEELAARVREATSGDGWVVDGNYQSKIGDLAWQRADTVVWLDLPRWRTISRSLRRTTERVLTRRELWSGNRESWRGFAVWRGEESILWWAWTSHRRVQERYAAALADPAYAHLRFVRLRSPREVRAFLQRPSPQ